ncbi:MAG: hypothetical protein C0184_09280 [Chloroflexus aggregans]|uniref:Putative zinc-finger domain-containing protein n=1 Tax=Chloroflexus aggregans TaxID=152260 RepID=A0A2J6X3S3_9CHLR|nr:MAG: hypothetical protein C0184_09280 [Chloroflexus aggregans]
MEEEQLSDGATHLSGLELIAAVDGEADETILAHLNECPLCRQRVATLRNLQHALRYRLYRVLCPSTDLLVDYCQGLLPPAQQARIAHHVASCPYCRSEVDLLMQRDPLIDRLLLASLLHGRVMRYRR